MVNTYLYIILSILYMRYGNVQNWSAALLTLLLHFCPNRLCGDGTSAEWMLESHPRCRWRISHIYFQICLDYRATTLKNRKLRFIFLFLIFSFLFSSSCCSTSVHVLFVFVRVRWFASVWQISQPHRVFCHFYSFASKADVLSTCRRGQNRRRNRK